MLEREIKFRIAEERDAAAVCDAIEGAGFRLESSGFVTHEDRYLDTDDWILYRAGIALRLRREGARLTLQAKTVRSQTEEALTRTEWAQEAPPTDPPWGAPPRARWHPCSGPSRRPAPWSDSRSAPGSRASGRCSAGCTSARS